MDALNNKHPPNPACRAPGEQQKAILPSLPGTSRKIKQKNPNQTIPHTYLIFKSKLLSEFISFNDQRHLVLYIHSANYSGYVYETVTQDTP